MLFYAVLGNPPYAFFSLLRVAVAVSTGLGAWALYVASKRYLPISFGLLLIGGIHLFGTMRRAQWSSFNWVAVVGLIVLTVILVLGILKKQIKTRVILNNSSLLPPVHDKTDSQRIHGGDCKN